MSLVEHLVATRKPLDLAKELARTAHDNAQLQRRVHELEVQQFWLTRPAPACMPPEGILHHALIEQQEYEARKMMQQSLDTIDAERLRRHERMLGKII